MNTFTVYPAIDLRSGDVVRLEQGQKERIKRFDYLPAQAAQHWIDQGADWLHVVNLDGAFGEDSQPNLAELEKIIEAAKPGASVQFGGGLRSIESIRSILSMGVKRVIIGTAAVEEPNLVFDALASFGPESVVLGVDASDGFVQVAGWEKNTGVTPIELVSRFIPEGLQTVIYTNVRRDGMQRGVDIQGTQQLADATGLQVIASGGVGSLEDIRRVKETGLPGVIVGRALYERSFTLSEAMKC
jgi:phosphoribosylformimino-5-aminoimidazole carboxamide ribotide isomerase